jgi:hypothetical protein
MYEIGAEVMHEWPGMAKVIEEMGELQQVFAKIMSCKGETTYWDETDLVPRLIEELADVQAALWFFMTMNEGRLMVDTQGDFKRMLAQRTRIKQDQYMEWHWTQMMEDAEALEEQAEVDGVSMQEHQHEFVDHLHICSCEKRGYDAAMEVMKFKGETHG